LSGEIVDQHFSAELAETEALFVRLRPTRVAAWLRSRGFALRSCASGREARIAILEAVNIPRPGAPEEPNDPGCLHSGGACMACLHLGEPSCRYYNRFPDRSTLHGPGGSLMPDA